MRVYDCDMLESCLVGRSRTRVLYLCLQMRTFFLQDLVQIFAKS